MSAAKAKGTRAETAVAAYLREHGWPTAERRAARGTKDAGDIAGLPVVVEVKNCHRDRLAEWVDEARQEARNELWRPVAGVVWHKRAGKGSPGDWFVTMTGEDFARMLAWRAGLPDWDGAAAGQPGQ